MADPRESLAAFAADKLAALEARRDGVRVATLPRSPAGTPYAAGPGAQLDRPGRRGAEPGSIGRAAGG